MSSFGKMPPEMKQLSPELYEKLVYESIDRIPVKTIIDQPSQNFKKDEDYGVSSYIKPAAWMYALENKLGKETFAKCIKAYYKRWSFRHPYPENMQQVFEQTSGEDLTAFFNQLSQKTQTFH